MSESFVNVDAREFKEFYKALSGVDEDIKKNLRKRMVKAAKPIVQAVKQAELEIPSQGGAAKEARKAKGADLGLRQSLAKATKADFKGTGKGAVIHIRVSRTQFVKVSGRSRSLPWYMEGRLKRPWRHPVFGNRENWVAQKPHPFLAVTVREHKQAFQREVDAAVIEAMDLAQKKISK